MHSAAALRADQ